MHIHPRLKISQRRHPTTPILANKIDEPALALPWPHLLKTNSSWRIGAELRLSFATCSAGHCSGTLRPRRLPSFTVSRCELKSARTAAGSLHVRASLRAGGRAQGPKWSSLVLLSSSFFSHVRLIYSRHVSHLVAYVPHLPCGVPPHLISSRSLVCHGCLYMAGHPSRLVPATSHHLRLSTDRSISEISSSGRS